MATRAQQNWISAVETLVLVMMISWTASGEGLPKVQFKCSTYKFNYVISKTGTGSLEACKKDKGTLVCIETREEWSFINNKLKNFREYEWYIGLKKIDNHWKWVNGKPLKWKREKTWPWAGSNPSGDGARVKIWKKDGKYLFDDVDGKTKLGYICEYPNEDYDQCKKDIQSQATTTMAVTDTTTTGTQNTTNKGTTATTHESMVMTTSTTPTTQTRPRASSPTTTTGHPDQTGITSTSQTAQDNSGDASTQRNTHESTMMTTSTTPTTQTTPIASTPTKTTGHPDQTGITSTSQTAQGNSGDASTQRNTKPIYAPSSTKTSPNGKPSTTSRNPTAKISADTQVQKDEFPITYLAIALAVLLLFLICMLVAIYCWRKRIKDKDGSQEDGIQSPTTDVSEIMKSNSFVAFKMVHNNIGDGKQPGAKLTNDATLTDGTYAEIKRSTSVSTPPGQAVNMNENSTSSPSQNVEVVYAAVDKSAKKKGTQEPQVTYADLASFNNNEETVVNMPPPYQPVQYAEIIGTKTSKRK